MGLPQRGNQFIYCLSQQCCCSIFPILCDSFLGLLKWLLRWFHVCNAKAVSHRQGMLECHHAYASKRLTGTICKNFDFLSHTGHQRDFTLAKASEMNRWAVYHSSILSQMINDWPFDQYRACCYGWWREISPWFLMRKLHHTHLSTPEQNFAAILWGAVYSCRAHSLHFIYLSPQQPHWECPLSFMCTACSWDSFLTFIWIG